MLRDLLVDAGDPGSDARIGFRVGSQQGFSLLHGHAQFVGQAVGGLPVDDAEVQGLAQLALLVGHVGFGDAQHAGGGSDMQVFVIGERIQNGGSLGEVGQDAEFVLAEYPPQVACDRERLQWPCGHGDRGPAKAGRCTRSGQWRCPRGQVAANDRRGGIDGGENTSGRVVGRLGIAVSL